MRLSASFDSRSAVEIRPEMAVFEGLTISQGADPPVVDKKLLQFYGE
jgi:hypothetical protein